ncbi:MAG: HlyD family efflux transporter periplasmic adaptor subunit [Saprospiraceae bacterium]|nr:HlyD family efflux transporter periplasmic adaptor subunit [Saprospiraceae bacterium]
MKIASILMAVFALFFVACADKSADEHGHEHEAGGLEPIAHILYSDKTELFVEFIPLIVNSKTNFAAHFTILGDKFLPLTKGKVTVSLIVGDSGIRQSADSASSPGIFKLALIPKTAGKGKLVFDIETKDFNDQIVINNVTIYADEHSALDNQSEHASQDEISYLKEQAWKSEFANAPVIKGEFADIIKTSGQILAAPGDEMMIAATSSGIIKFSGSKTIVGSEVSQNRSMFTISGGNLTENNLDANIKEAKANFDKAKANYDRSKELVKDKIISEAAFLEAKNDFENTQSLLNAISKNYSASGQTIGSPISGFVKNIFVNEGQYVEAGMPLAVVSKNKKLILQANVSQKYFGKLQTISSANFVPIGSDQVFDTKKLNGKIISYGKSTSANSAFLPITFEIDNIGNLVPGSAAEIYLKSSLISNALLFRFLLLWRNRKLLCVCANRRRKFSKAGNKNCCR